MTSRLDRRIRPGRPRRTGVGGSAGGGGGGGTDLVGALGWSHAWWAEGTNFALQGYSDTDTITNFPDEVGSIDIPLRANTPQYQASNALLNSKPAIDSNTNGTLRTAALSPTIALPVTYVVVGRLVTTGSYAYLIDDTGGTPRVGIINSLWGMLNTVQLRGGALDTTAGHLYRFYINGGSSVIEIDGTVAASGNVGTADTKIDRISLFHNDGTQGNTIDFEMAFLGLFEGDAAGEAGWADFKADVASHYGLTIA